MDDAGLRQELRRLAARMRSASPPGLDDFEAREDGFAAARSPLLRAEFALLRARLHETRRPLAEQSAALETAVLTFAANGRSREKSQCVAQLAYWYNLSGHEVSAVAAARWALRQPELPLEDRLALFLPVAMAYAHQLRLGDAWQAWERHFAADHARCRNPQLAGALRSALASLHFFSALRARRLPTVYSLDLAEGAPDEAAFERHMAQVEALLSGDGLPGSLTAVEEARQRDLRGMVCALRGDLAGLERHLADPPGPPEPGNPRHGQVSRLYNLGWAWRIAGRPERALPCLRAAQAQADAGSKLAARLPYDLSCTLGALGQAQAAHEELRAFLRLRSAAAAADLATLGRLQDLSVRAGAAAPGARSALPQARPAAAEVDPIRLQQSEPPSLQRLQRLLAEPGGLYLKPAEVAERLGISLRSLQAALQRYRGSSLVALQREQRLRQAAEHLRHTDRPIKDIAEQAGFADSAGFTHAFRRMLGLSPSQYRQRAAPALPADSAQADARASLGTEDPSL